jgi:SAM-dependent methyltransferase
VKIGAIPEGILERIALRTGVVPTPVLETLQAILLARSIMAATQLGLFEALADGPLPAEEVARRAETRPGPTTKLLGTLVALGYLRREGARYALAPTARRWLLADSPGSLRDSMLFRYLEWDLAEGMEAYVRTGRPLDVHRQLDDDQWGIYQRGMRSVAASTAEEVAKRLPVPSNASSMLDIGGSHGYYSVCLCRRHPSLRATILDLPEAVKHAAPILAREGMGDRVVHREGDALVDDLGESAHDVIFIASLVHHFREDANRELARRAARALKPGGIFVIFDVLRPARPEDAGQLGALMDLYFALTSESGTWSLDEMTSWQREAGLAPVRPLRMRSVPGLGAAVARKPA